MIKKTVSAQLNELYDLPRSHTGNDQGMYGSPLVPSLNFSSAFSYESESELVHYHQDKFESHRYLRDSSPLVQQNEKIFQKINDGQSLLFSSGMKAVWSVLWATLENVDTYVTFGAFYRKTQLNLEEICRKCRKSHKNFSSVRSGLESLTGEKNLLFFLESPSNPFLNVLDVSLIRETFPDSIIVYDNTLAGLLNDKIDLSICDYVVASCTKYIGGHNDVIGGLVTTFTDEDYQKVWAVRSAQGGIMDQMSAYLLFRSLKTYDLRMDSILRNVERVLDFLFDSPDVEQVYYPGRGENASEEESFKAAYMHGGGLVSFTVSSELEDHIAENLTLLHSTKMAPSFGSTDALIERPVVMSHYGTSSERLAEMGLSAKLVRFSVGMEPIDFILADLGRLTERAA